MDQKIDVGELRKLAKSLCLDIEITTDIVNIVKEMHFGRGLGIPKIREELKNELIKLNWFIKEKPVKGLSNFILKLLGYSNWDDYKKNRRKINRSRL